MDNQTTQAGVAIESTPLFGSPLAEVTDADQLREMADKLWSLLDDIDTASDQIKPANEAGYRRFYEYAMKKAEARHAIITSDGYELYLPNARPHAEARSADSVQADVGPTFSFGKYRGYVCDRCGEELRNETSRDVHYRRAQRGLGCQANAGVRGGGTPYPARGVGLQLTSTGSGEMADAPETGAENAAGHGAAIAGSSPASPTISLPNTTGEAALPAKENA